MQNFVDFVAYASKNHEVGKEFIDSLKKHSAEELHKWFDGKGYEVSIDDCKKLTDNQDTITDIKEISVKMSY